MCVCVYDRVFPCVKILPHLILCCCRVSCLRNADMLSGANHASSGGGGERGQFPLLTFLAPPDPLHKHPDKSLFFRKPTCLLAPD